MTRRRLNSHASSKPSFILQILIHSGTLAQEFFVVCYQRIFFRYLNLVLLHSRHGGHFGLLGGLELLSQGQGILAASRNKGGAEGTKLDCNFVDFSWSFPVNAFG